MAKRSAYFARHKYGINITQAQYEAMHARQEGKCACCGDQPKRLTIDHRHDDGLVRALLCNRCNFAVGFLEHPLRPQWEAYIISHETY